MSKILVSLSLLLVLVGASIAAELRFAGDHQLSKEEAVKAFDEFEEYLEEKENANDADGLAPAKRLIPNRSVRETLSQQAAKIYVYLNEFEKCEPKAIGYMRDVLRGREYAMPGLQAMGPHYSRPKTRLEKLLENTLDRGFTKCSSFVETWFKDTESKLEPNSKKLLYEYVSHDLLKPGNTYKLADRVVDNILKDENLSKQLSGYSHDQLLEFFYDNFTENLIKPCSNYLDVMSPFMETIKGLGLLRSKPRNILFDEPSSDLLDSRSRFTFCKLFGRGSTSGPADSFANKCALLFEQGKKDVLNEAEQGKGEASSEVEEETKDVSNVAEQVQV